ncbi:zinc ABC transporter substrate-binding protein [Bacillus sp. B15-48]|uniref:metal ABC transporter solute-binding protein, Zn/Mn family n=1 Tax=Bacillus sp. B15-48 TaxID=1548601 RepID=UPI00193FB3F4|nr:zinc ABC transporter substrate-binding protein [Bacillus sp. B15-48]MBM4762891.1 ABC transporter substrate-binding protein [Bacillus sp. B15-48]
MNVRKWFTTSVLASSLLLAACGNSETSSNEENIENETLKVFTTIFPLEDFTKKIGGDHVDVQSVLPPNVDAHTYEPSTRDMIALAESDLFIYTGIGVEGFADKATEILKNEEVTILAAGKGIELIESSDDHDHAHHHEDDHDNEHGDDNHHEEAHGHEHDDSNHHEEAHGHEHDDDNHREEAHGHEHDNDNHHEEAHGHEHDDDNHHEEAHGHAHETEDDNHNHGDEDPHVWLDPIRSIALAENIKNSLSELMPEQAEEFEQNFVQLKAELEKLDQEFITTIDNAQTKHLLVSHAAYGYWEERYGIKQIPITGISPTQEPSQKALKTIIEESKEHQIQHVIFDQNLTTKIAEIVQKEIGAEALTLHNLETITEENIEQGDDYFSIMRKNLQTIEIALNNK